MERGAVSLLLTSLCMAASDAPPVLAAGGKDIASAPLVTFGQQQVGNTATDGGQGPGTAADSCPGPKENSWWNLPVTASDAVTIDYTTSGQPGASGQHGLYLYSVGTTDHTVQQTSPEVRSESGTNGKGQIVFTATRSGTMPMVISAFSCYRNDIAGPYNFTAYVRHAVLLSVPRQRSLRRTGTINVTVRNPDGGPISDAGLSVALQVRRGSSIRTVGRATSANGVASISYRVPASLRRRRVGLRAQAKGDDYITKTSSSQSLKVR
jgi:hypothetical protein